LMCTILVELVGMLTRYEAFNWMFSLCMKADRLQNNFYRQIRNLILDLTIMPANALASGIHWQVAQATQLQNIVFNMRPKSVDNQQRGIFMDNGSGGFMCDLIFNGGNVGFYLGNQQFTSRNLTFNSCNTGIYMNWDWLWAFKGNTFNDCNIGIDLS